MNISDLQKVLSEALNDFGDLEVFIIEKKLAHQITYLGASEHIGDGEHLFWITTNNQINFIESDPDSFRAKTKKPILQIVK